MKTDARLPNRHPVRGRALLALAVVAAAVGVVLVVVALAGGPDPDAAVLEIDEAVVATLPSTVPPLATLPPDAGVTAVPDDGVADRDDPATAESPDAESPDGAATDEHPLAELLGPQGSAIPPEIEPRLRPVELRIDDIFVDDPVRPVGLEDDGQLEIPDADEIGWYRYGAAPGYAGSTVLAAHVTWNGEYGPFLNLGDLDLGEHVEVTLEDGTTRTYEVTERTMYDKNGLPRERIWRTSGDETLVLITCGGDFNPDINRYRQNIVVYAVPVA